MKLTKLLMLKATKMLRSRPQQTAQHQTKLHEPADQFGNGQLFHAEIFFEKTPTSTWRWKATTDRTKQLNASRTSAE